MAFDATQPTNTTKIRNLGVVIRPNWQAIQQADSSFKPYATNINDRTAALLPVDPTAIAATYITYCKQAASGNPELYGISASSVVAQLTDAGAIGGPTQTFRIASFQIGSNTTSYDRNNIIHTYGQCSSSGAGSGLANCTVARTAEGRYAVTFINNIPISTNYMVTMCPIQGTGQIAAQFYIVKTSNTTFTMHTLNSAGQYKDTTNNFMVCGGF